MKRDGQDIMINKDKSMIERPSSETINTCFGLPLPQRGVRKASLQFSVNIGMTGCEHKSKAL